MIICDDCGHENASGSVLCDNCGVDLYDMLMDQVATRQLERSEKDSLALEEPTSSNPLLLYVDNNAAPLSINRSQNQTIGRIDPATGETVEIDLTDFGGRDYGVSRKHAILDAAANIPTITDLGSYNGTFINGNKLSPNECRELKSGDEVQIGRLRARVYYK